VVPKILKSLTGVTAALNGLTAPFIEIGSTDAWTIADDVVMGGKSHSDFTIQVDEKDQSRYVAYEGVTNLNGGGFCTIRDALETPADLSSFAGICVSMRSAVKKTYQFYL